ncbi:P-type DNA transfer protein VirB5 [Aquamicrobium sp. LC103]|uniref:P-type DNA transfer protein VirB5 n=1 Tax=Aquamicrobium sp. LC103 TaxID=1120658 RepID=UPI00063E88C6|nr:P-type DNA transfer protein VirB5 [Aquamicrobium sp. LC103]TKT75685.1 P-type DNA transfer protein VirB5 [Aquamicrobium sp. LC103]
MTQTRTALSAAFVAFLLSTGDADAQGMPVIDKAAILKHIESITQLKSQLDALNQQIAQADQLLGSLNKVTNMADVASVLNQPAIRNALPDDFAEIESLIGGDGADIFGDAAARFLERNSSYRISANDFYTQELARAQNRNAGQLALGQQIYDAATKRIDGIDQLRRQISNAHEAKDIADLQARIQAESAFLQTDFLRMQGLHMIQQAQLQVEQQRQAEDWRRRIDKMNSALSP